jgi:hypothetical protein
MTMYWDEEQRLFQVTYDDAPISETDIQAMDSYINDRIAEELMKYRNKLMIAFDDGSDCGTWAVDVMFGGV